MITSGRRTVEHLQKVTPAHDSCFSKRICTGSDASRPNDHWCDFGWSAESILTIRGPLGQLASTTWLRKTRIASWRYLLEMFYTSKTTCSRLVARVSSLEIISFEIGGICDFGSWSILGLMDIHWVNWHLILWNFVSITRTVSWCDCLEMFYAPNPLAIVL